MLLKLTKAAQISTVKMLPFIREKIGRERSQFFQTIFDTAHSGVTAAPPQKNPHNREMAVILALTCGFFVGSRPSTTECQNEVVYLKDVDKNHFKP